MLVSRERRESLGEEEGQEMIRYCDRPVHSDVSLEKKQLRFIPQKSDIAAAVQQISTEFGKMML